MAIAPVAQALFFAIGLRKGLMDFAIEWYEQRRDSAKERAR